jgi:ketosteroid isomerase-like protein
MDMRTVGFVVAVALAPAGSASAQAVDSNRQTEELIRKLEQQDAEAVLRGDFATMERTWADDFTVNSPGNRVTKGKADVLKLIRAGNIGTYAMFVREVESVTLRDDVAIVMGTDLVKRTSKAAPTDQVVRRRYMNVWTKRGDAWLLTARQANVVCEN